MEVQAISECLQPQTLLSHSWHKETIVTENNNNNNNNMYFKFWGLLLSQPHSQFLHCIILVFLHQEWTPTKLVCKWVMHQSFETPHISVMRFFFFETLDKEDKETDGANIEASWRNAPWTLCSSLQWQQVIRAVVCKPDRQTDLFVPW